MSIALGQPMHKPPHDRIWSAPMRPVERQLTRTVHGSIERVEDLHISSRLPERMLEYNGCPPTVEEVIHKV
jgi:hypothetical protein